MYISVYIIHKYRYVHIYSIYRRTSAKTQKSACPGHLLVSANGNIILIVMQILVSLNSYIKVSV
jgi:hypothetical protein